MNRFKSVMLGVAMASAVGLTAGCDTLLQDLNLGATRVTFVNNGDHPVQILLAFDENPAIGDDVIDDVGTQSAYTVAAGDSMNIAIACPLFQAVKVVEAELQVDDNGGPTASSDTLRAGTDFNCGDTVTFTFDHSALLVDFAVESSVDMN